MQEVTIEMKKRYCTHCGGLMMIREILTGEFDDDTGEPLTKIYQTCPNYLKGRGFWGDWKWVEHDNTEVFSIKRII